MDKLERLYQYLEDLGSICIGFSGGVDSTFLSLVSGIVLGEKAVLVTASSPFITKGELSFAVEFAKKAGLFHRIAEIRPDDIVLQNTKDRCYYCKYETFLKISEIAKEYGISHIADGANVDDTGDYRPGTRATAELGVISPLKELGFTKADIREYLEKLLKQNPALSGCDIYKKPAMACLASRVPYGTVITEEILSMVGRAEEYIRKALEIDTLRVRYHNEVARIEVLPDEFGTVLNNAPAIAKKLKTLGFHYITLDVEGIRQGSMNEVLDLNDTENKEIKSNDAIFKD